MQDFPIIECPYCGKKQQVDDYYEFSDGDTFHCKYCNKKIIVRNVEIIVSAHLEKACPE